MTRLGWMRWAAAACVAGLALSGCTRPDEPDIRPTLPDPSIAIVTEPTLRRLEGGSVPVNLGVALPGVRGVASESHQRFASFIQYPQVDDAPAFNQQISAWISEHTASMATAPADHVSELNMGWTVVTTDPYRFGTMLVAREHRGEHTDIVYRTLLQDRSNGAVGTTQAYFSPTGCAALTTLSTRVLGTHGIAVLSTPVTPAVQAALCDGLGLDEGGNVVVAIDVGLLAEEREGALALTLPREQVRPLLNARGVAWLDGTAPPGATGTPRPLPEESVAPTTNPVPLPSVDCREIRCVAITIENGPSDATGASLAVLEREGVRATFFVLGVNVELYPQAIRNMAEDGHVVGSHSWDHMLLTGMPKPVAAARIRRTNDALEALTGSRPTLMRAPFDELPTGMSTDGTAVIGWSVDLAQKPGQTAAQAVANAMPQIGDGTIVRIPENSQETPALLGVLIPKLRAAGFVPVSINDLLGTSLVPGQVYTQR